MEAIQHRIHRTIEELIFADRDAVNSLSELRSYITGNDTDSFNAKTAELLFNRFCNAKDVANSFLDDINTMLQELGFLASYHEASGVSIPVKVKKEN